jgi:two-component system, NtrC family, response regulator HydG
LITGESGTGKELCARAIHAASPGHYHPLVVIHCGALTETLLESELFGHEKGAFTGAQYRKKGSFEVADGGAVFLDEIGDISLKTQTDLLRVLQEREIIRVGSTTHPIHVDFRCVAATNKDVQKLVDEGKFRPDLFYRLNVFQIQLPALRERKEDIPIRVDHFVRKFSASMNKRITRVAPAAMTLLDRYTWPGNVRELKTRSSGRWSWPKSRKFAKTILRCDCLPAKMLREHSRMWSASTFWRCSRNAKAIRHWRRKFWISTE